MRWNGECGWLEGVTAHRTSFYLSAMVSNTIELEETVKAVLRVVQQLLELTMAVNQDGMLEEMMRAQR